MEGWDEETSTPAEIDTVDEPHLLGGVQTTKRDRLLASLTWIAGAGLSVAFPFARREGAEFFLHVTAALHLSARGFHRMLRVARTIADLAGADAVGRIHVAAALSYRRLVPRN